MALATLVLQNLINLFHRQAAVEIESDQHGRRLTTSPQTTGRQEGENAIGRRFSRLDAQLLLEISIDFFAAPAPATDGIADMNHPFAHRLTIYLYRKKYKLLPLEEERCRGVAPSAPPLHPAPSHYSSGWPAGYRISNSRG